MDKEQEVNLLICKFQNSKKANQEKFLEHVFRYLHMGTEIAKHTINILEGNPIIDKKTGLSIGNKFYIDLNIVSSYPKIHRKYYEEKNLLINDSIIEVEFVRYNLFDQSIGVKVFTDLTIESVVDISTSYIIYKSELNIM
jgi:hypothetical protein